MADAGAVTVADLAAELAEVKAMLAQLLAASQAGRDVTEPGGGPDPVPTSELRDGSPEYIQHLAARIAAGDREALREHNRRRDAARKKTLHIRKRR